MNNALKPFLGMIAFGAVLAAPVAFAQDAATQQEPQDPTTHTPTTGAPEATSSQALTWADLDVDGDGKLSRQEASSIQSLAQVFDDADADSDGLLTSEEYKAYVASVGSNPPGADGGSD